MDITRFEELNRLRRLAIRVADVPWDYNQESFPTDDGDVSKMTFVCPLCEGEGAVEGTSMIINHSHFCAGVEVFGVGPVHAAVGQYVKAMRPEVVISLVDIILNQQMQIEVLKSERNDK